MFNVVYRRMSFKGGKNHIEGITTSSPLVMLPLHTHIKHHLMKIPLPPRPPQPLHVLLPQIPPNNPLQLLLANLFISLRLLRRPKPWLKARLHAHPHRRLKRDRARIAPNLHTPGSLRALLNRQERLRVPATRLQRKRARDIGRRDHEKRLVVRDCRGRCAEEPVAVAR